MLRTLSTPEPLEVSKSKLLQLQKHLDDMLRCDLSDLDVRAGRDIRVTVAPIFRHLRETSKLFCGQLPAGTRQRSIKAS
jgi:hypothetical protein